MELISEFYRNIGSIICHQLPDRTLSINGSLLPLCARDTGIYAGFFISFLFLLTVRRLNADRPPKIKMSMILLTLMLPMLFDGISSYLGVRNTTNTIRLVTGSLFGMCLLVFLLPAANFKIDERNNKAIIKNYWEIVALIGLNLLLCATVLKTGFIPWGMIASASVLGFIFFISYIVYTLIKRITEMKGSMLLILTAGFTTVVLGLMYLFSSTVLQPLKKLLL